MYLIFLVLMKMILIKLRYHYEENMSDPYKTLGVEPHTNIEEDKK